MVIQEDVGFPIFIGFSFDKIEVIYVKKSHTAVSREDHKEKE